MARSKGTASFSANFEPQVAAPLDARFLVPTKAELILPATWTANDGGIYAHNGMVTVVYSDLAPTNNGVYWLTGADYTVATNWKHLGAGDLRSGTFIWDNEDLANAYYTANPSLEIEGAARFIAAQVEEFSSSYLVIGIP